MKKHFLFIIGIYCITLSVRSQNTPQLPTVIPPSPTVANLMNFEEVPVDYYTGQPDISIPLFNKQLNSELSLPVVLKYNTMGVRIEQRSGWTGTGWSLDVGGVVSRTIRGIPDELPSSGAYDNKTGLFHLPDFWNWENVSDSIKNTFIWNVNGSPTAIYDSEPDLYQFNMPGISGRFVIVYEGSSYIAKQLSLDQKLDIQVNMNSTTKKVNGFTITDANGYKYTFGIVSSAIETTVYEDHTIIKPRNPLEIAAPVESTNLPSANTAWHLTSIKTSNGVELAGFTYGNYPETYNTPFSRTDNELLNPQSHQYTIQSSYNLGIYRPLWVMTTTEVTTQTKKLLKVTFTDKTTLNFELSTLGSHPENGGVYLNKIQMKDRLLNNVRAYSFSYDTTSENNRLWLVSVDGGNGQQYYLEYFEKEDLPGFDGRHDAWGYNNGDFRSSDDYGYNYYDFNAVKRGLLTKIIYPTGGTKTFTWEPHTFTYEGNIEIDDYDQNPRNSVNKSLTHSFTANSNNPATYSPGSTLNITHLQYLQVSKTGISGTADSSKFEVHFTKSGYTQEVRLGLLPEVISLPPGTYTVTVKVDILETTQNSATLSGNINIKYVERRTGDDYRYYLLGGGVRINEISFTDPENTSSLPVTVNYDYNMYDDIDLFNYGEELVSSGSIDSKLGSMYKEYQVTDKKYMYTNGDQQTMNPKYSTYNVKTNGVNVQLTKGNYVVYKRVKEVRGMYAIIGINESYGLSGCNVYTFTSPIDFPSPAGVFAYPYINNSNLDHKRGLLLSKVVYDKNGQKQEEIINTYDYDAREEAVVKSFTITPDECEWTQFYNKYESYVNMVPTFIVTCGVSSCFGGNYLNCSTIAPFNVYWTTIKGMAAELQSSQKTTYLGGNPVTSTTTYDYWDQNFQIKSQTETYTEGASTITYKTEYEYPVSYTSAYFNADEINEMANMVNLNMVNKPVVITQLRNGSVLQRVINKYDTFAANQIMIKEVETQKGTSVAEDRILYERYNSIGNIEQVREANGLPISYVWGYEGTLPIVKAENCLYTSIPNAATLQTTSNTGAESTLRSQLDAMRNSAAMASSMVTTLTHDPCKGVLTVTDPRGKKQSYEYEPNPGWRLKKVKDDEGKMLNEYFYNFRGSL